MPGPPPSDTARSTRPRARRAVVALVVVAALCAVASCGGGGGGHSDNQGDTPTPVPTPTTSGGSTATVTLTVTAAAPLQSFRANIAYPIGKGSFRGSADAVACSTGASGTFVKNDRDDGGLVLALAQATNLTFPVSIACTFDVAAGQTFGPGDLTASILSVTSNGAVGNATSAAVAVAVAVQ